MDGSGLDVFSGREELCEDGDCSSGGSLVDKDGVEVLSGKCGAHGSVSFCLSGVYEGGSAEKVF